VIRVIGKIHDWFKIRSVISPTDSILTKYSINDTQKVKHH
jgi:hypothetical protein